MDPDGGLPDETPPTVSPQPLRRRLSMEEDYFYQEVMTLRRAPSQPPVYESAVGPPTAKGKGKNPAVPTMAVSPDEEDEEEEEAPESGGEDEVIEVLPSYKCDIEMEGAFQLKMEIEEAIKRAEYRNWRTVIVQLRGTALNIYHAKKDWGWRSKSKEGPDISPDYPPWLTKKQLEKSYSLAHADVGIAADYHKRRYVIRVRAETDQFLISCIELQTFVRWLDALFAAIEVAAPIDDRDFPRDQSIPRIQRIRWFRGQHAQPASPAAPAAPASTASPAPVVAASASGGGGGGRDSDRHQQPPRLTVQQTLSPATIAVVGNAGPSTEVSSTPASQPPDVPGPSRRPAPATDAMGRLSTTSYPNEGIDPQTGKWHPRHRWTTHHDMVYAKLCYAVLLFKSPRKSNYIIVKGKQWYIDWTTGKMVRVRPPGYDEPEANFGPWQVIHPENARI
ncbi:PH domain-containing protein [Pleurostoma richardsiae]|uniref:PH domain-containing protein n=1 Tax=Pleurostoma richardsiae TaxID=41990 RepID=A0AA38VY89_9PEZI|nr:PH domain-containing protein [Pleurostoma richardsiae]